MKKILSAFLAALMLVCSISFVSAQTVNEPTTEELEAIIKLVKPKIYVPEECKEFTWRFNAKTAYRDASWNLTWQTPDGNTYGRVVASCDEDGNITSYTYNSDNRVYGQLPKYLKSELKATADEFIKKALPEAYENVKYESASASGIYSGQYTYKYVRYIDGNIFPDNSITVGVDYITGNVVQMNATYDYSLETVKYDSIITPEKAREILGTRQKMNLKYLTKIVTDETTKERTVKAYLVYVPEVSYLAVDAGTGEIYDTKSSWQVVGGAAGGASNSVMMDKAEAESTRKENGYELTEEEKAGVKELEGLISKEEAIKAVTGNKYLYIDSSLTAVDGTLCKNYAVENTATYQNDNGSYIWSVSFSNPVFDNKYYNNAYANATVNAENGEIISFNCNLNNYVYYADNKLDIPDIKFDIDEARAIGESFLKETIPEKFASSEKSGDHAVNMISYAGHNDVMKDTIYGAHSFNYRRVNEGIPFDRNSISVGVDCVTGKIFSFSCNWWTNVEFESPKGAITPEKALDCLVSFDGYGLVYERNITYLYTPVTESSKKDVCAAFVASLMRTLQNGGDITPVIKKYAKDIDKDKLVEILDGGDEKAVYAFAAEYFGVKSDEVVESASQYVDSSLFYDKAVDARLVYTCYSMASKYVSPFSGKQLDYNGEEYKPPITEYTYNDLSGHWIENNALLLADVGIGFEGGSFNSDKIISEKEFAMLSQAIGIYCNLGEGDNEVDRIGAIRLILNSLGYEKVATLKGIYKTEFADNDTIKDEDIGYTAIGFALGIIKGDGGNANIYSKLTRAQAVSLLVNALSVAR